MFARHALAGAVGLCLATAPALHAQPSAGPSPTDGLWGGGYRSSKGGQLELRLTAIGDLARFDLEARRWFDLGSLECHYVMRLNGAGNGHSSEHGPGQSYLNTATSTSEGCPAEVAFALTRSDAQTLTLAPAADLAPILSNLPDITLSGTLRPPRPEDLHAPVAGLDILGISPGMTRPQTETLLKDAGFAPTGKRYARRGSGYRIQEEVWGRRPLGNAAFADRISVQYTPAMGWNDLPERVSLVQRMNSPESPTSVGALEEALAKKYGPPYREGRAARSYAADGGNMTDGQPCRIKGPHQTISYRHVPFERNGSLIRPHERRGTVNVYCGPTLSVRIDADESSGTVRDFRLSIVDPTPLWQSFWLTWSHREAAAIRAEFDSLGSADTDLPDL
ncbi:hypothetical protein KM176_23985 [Pseudooceanicola sp. CBS1P-1]|uniref:DUF3108 domain-containing protein n=1 Tax=Pseudooceanicola albus TaxID=2692189 RepID=A0A6L7GAP4_9RHOB|nr:MULTISPECIES: hypothetical protein [Pseudooceanicola]MBT9386923.1 hypothetical protein [Pseudooceanicola endophyticus]MXN21029.1 hypothetical protein [Pseudooceanicola albus]